MQRYWSVVLAVLVVGVVSTGCSGRREPQSSPQGETRSRTTEALQTGAAALQRHAPVEGLDMYLVGFHPMRDDSSHQMEAHHFCRQVNEDFAQCALFDGNTKQANLNGIEYIISAKLFDSLPGPERQFWHPHNYEILSGQLVAPGIPQPAEKEVMRRKMNSYGKTWHVWMTGDKDLPLGPPNLAWSFTKDGQIKPDLLKSRDDRMGINTEAKRREREDLRSLAQPQSGETTLKP